MECGTTNGHKYIYFNLGLVQKQNKLIQHSCSVHVSDRKAGFLIWTDGTGFSGYIIAACRTNTDTTTKANGAGCRS